MAVRLRYRPSRRRLRQHARDQSAGRVGNAGKGILTGPGYSGTDFSLMKRFSVGENKSLQFRAEVFDATNHANFFPVTTVADSATFGTTGSALDNRQIQFGLKFVY